jgi:hypothetical protein
MRYLCSLALVLAAACAFAATSPAAPVPVTSAFAIPVVCTDSGLPTWASASYGSGRIAVRPSLCTAIARAQAGRVEGRVQMGMAALGVLMLAHELSHALGTVDRNVTASGEDPSEANCAAWHLFPWVTWRLGIRRGLGLRLLALVDDAGRSACAKIGA